MPVHPQIPIKFRRDIVDQRRDAGDERGDGGRAIGPQIGGAGAEQHFGLKDEAIAGDADVVAFAQHVAKLAEKR